MSVKISSDFIVATASGSTGTNNTRVNESMPTRDLPARGNNLPSPAVKAAEAREATQAATNEYLDKAIKKLNDNVQMVQRELEFSVDQDSGKTVIKVMDLSTKEVIRQIPNEEALNFARKLGEGVNLELLSEYT